MVFHCFEAYFLFLHKFKGVGCFSNLRRHGIKSRRKSWTCCGHALHCKYVVLLSRFSACDKLLKRLQCSVSHCQESSSCSNSFLRPWKCYKLVAKWYNHLRGHEKALEPWCLLETWRQLYQERKSLQNLLHEELNIYVVPIKGNPDPGCAPSL